MEVRGQLIAQAASPSGEDPQHPLDMKTGWAPEPVWTLSRTGKSVVPAGNRTDIDEMKGKN
jgi:hypothetical protein